MDRWATTRSSPTATVPMPPWRQRSSVASNGSPGRGTACGRCRCSVTRATSPLNPTCPGRSPARSTTPDSWCCSPAPSPPRSPWVDKEVAYWCDRRTWRRAAHRGGHRRRVRVGRGRRCADGVDATLCPRRCARGSPPSRCTSTSAGRAAASELSLRESAIPFGDRAHRRHDPRHGPRRPRERGRAAPSPRPPPGARRRGDGAGVGARRLRGRGRGGGQRPTGRACAPATRSAGSWGWRPSTCRRARSTRRSCCRSSPPTSTAAAMPSGSRPAGR